MAFRDDLSAALSRVDALERELAECRGERDAATEERNRLRSELDEAREELAKLRPKAAKAAGKAEKAAAEKTAAKKAAKSKPAKSDGVAAPGAWAERLIPAAFLLGTVGLGVFLGTCEQRASNRRARAALLARPPELFDVDVGLTLATHVAHLLVPGAELIGVSAELVDASGHAQLARGGRAEYSFSRDLPPSEHPAGIPLGAPVPPDQRACYLQIHAAQTGWSSGTSSGCTGTRVRARCPPALLWKTAIAKGAPADGLARLALDWVSLPDGDRGYRDAPAWRLTINDQGQSIFDATFDQDCQLVEAR